MTFFKVFKDQVKVYFALMSVAGAASGLQILRCREAQAFDSPFEAFLSEPIVYEIYLYTL